MTPEIKNEILAFGKLKCLNAQALTGVVMTFLWRKNIETIPMAGTVHFGEVKSELYFWLDLPDGRRIDMRLAEQFHGQRGLPTGIVHPKDYPEVKYDGFPIRYALLADNIFDNLVNEDSSNS